MRTPHQPVALLPHPQPVPRQALMVTAESPRPCDMSSPAFPTRSWGMCVVIIATAIGMGRSSVTVQFMDVRSNAIVRAPDAEGVSGNVLGL